MAEAIRLRTWSDLPVLPQETQGDRNSGISCHTSEYQRLAPYMDTAADGTPIKSYGNK